MKKIKKRLLIAIVFLVIVCSLNVFVINNSYAVNQISSNSTSNTTSSNKSSGSSSSKKSSNANLKMLGIKPNDFSGFKATKTSYDVTVSTNVTEVEVYATAQDEGATVQGTGKKKLDEGKTVLDVTVTAEDGTTKKYTINITRSDTNQSSKTKKDNDGTQGLSELTVEGLELTPEFSTDIYEYTVNYIGENTKLDISAIATDSDYIIEMTGNENLQEGENIITILVSDSDNSNIATYQIIVNKKLVDDEAVQKEQEEKQKQKIIIVGSIVAGIVLLIIIIFIVKHKKNSYYDDEYDDEYDEDDVASEFEQIYSQDFEEPKSLRRAKKEENKEKNDDFDATQIIDNKEALKQEFLNNYNSNNYNEYDKLEEENPHKRRKNKGKRFK